VLTFGWQNAVLFAQMMVNVASVTVAAALMYPAMASDNGIPLWPWIAPAYFTGVLPLLAYITAWQPKPRMRLPPTASQMVSQHAVQHHYTHGLINLIILLHVHASVLARIYCAAMSQCELLCCIIHILDISAVAHHWHQQPVFLYAPLACIDGPVIYIPPGVCTPAKAISVPPAA
jgi:hypothetical protein